MTKAETVAHLINQHLQSANAEMYYDREVDAIVVLVPGSRPPLAVVVEF